MKPGLFQSRAEGEFLGSDGGEGTVDAAGDLAVAHGADHRQFLGRPPGIRADEIETAAHALGHCASEFLGLGPVLDAADSLAIALGSEVTACGRRSMDAERRVEG
jgi:hypothetical protein